MYIIQSSNQIIQEIDAKTGANQVQAPVLASLLRDDKAYVKGAIKRW